MEARAGDHSPADLSETSSWREFWHAPVRVRLYLLAVAAATGVLLFLVGGATGTAKPV